MFNRVTRQERQVLLFVAGAVLAGIILHYLQKPHCRGGSRTTPTVIDKKISLNQASFEELVSLPEIGPALAHNILEYRQAHGPFNSLEDLEKVKGLGPKKLERLQDYLDLDTRGGGRGGE